MRDRARAAGRLATRMHPVPIVARRAPYARSGGEPSRFRSTPRAARLDREQPVAVARMLVCALAVIGCGREPAPRAGAELERHERVALEGDPAIGTVVLVREIHGCPRALLPQLGDERRHAVIVSAVVRYQVEILRELDREEARHVFADGVGALWLAGHLGPEDGLRERTRSAFARIPREETTGFEAGVLFELGAAYVHAARRPDVVVHETEDDEIFRLGFQANTVEHPELHDVRDHLDTGREAAIAARVAAFLRAHPGETAFLILGRDHRITDDLARAGPPPLVRAIWWGEASIPGQDLPPLGDP